MLRGHQVDMPNIRIELGNVQNEKPRTPKRNECSVFLLVYLRYAKKADGFQGCIRDSHVSAFRFLDVPAWRIRKPRVEEAQRSSPWPPLVALGFDIRRGSLLPSRGYLPIHTICCGCGTDPLLLVVSFRQR